MKAVVMREFGGPEVLHYEEIETPKVGPDDVLVEVRAVSVNRTLDLAVREKAYVRVPPLPHILGVDPSGTIAAVGVNVKQRKVGERVYVSLFVPTDDPAAAVRVIAECYARHCAEVRQLSVGAGVQQEQRARDTSQAAR